MKTFNHIISKTKNKHSFTLTVKVLHVTALHRGTYHDPARGKQQILINLSYLKKTILLGNMVRIPLQHTLYRCLPASPRLLWLSSHCYDRFLKAFLREVLLMILPDHPASSAPRTHHEDFCTQISMKTILSCILCTLIFHHIISPSSQPNRPF